MAKRKAKSNKAKEAIIYALDERSYLTKTLETLKYLRTVLAKDDTSDRIRIITTDKVAELERFIIREGFAKHLGVPKVGHIAADKCDIYIGRKSSKYGLEASIWANPYKASEDMTPLEAVEYYGDYLIKNEELCNHIPSLVGKTLGCWCKKSDCEDFVCHGDVIAAFYLEWIIECWKKFGFSGYKDGIGQFDSPYTGKVIYDIRKRWKTLYNLSAHNLVSDSSS